MNDELKSFREAVLKFEELMMNSNDLINHLQTNIPIILKNIENEKLSSNILIKSSGTISFHIESVYRELKQCQNTQASLVSKIENDLYDNLITKFTPEFSEKVVDKLILTELNKFEIKLNSVLKSSDILIEKSTDLQNDYIKNKDNLCSSVGVIINIINKTKDEFEKDYERLKIDFRSASNSHQNILVKYQKEINNQLENEFKEINTLKTISIVSSSIFTGMTFMYFLFPFLH